MSPDMTERLLKEQINQICVPPPPRIDCSSVDQNGGSVSVLHYP